MFSVCSPVHNHLKRNVYHPDLLKQYKLKCDSRSIEYIDFCLTDQLNITYNI